MKLSEIRGERVFDVIADIIEPVTVIAQDEEAVKLFDTKSRPDNMTPWEYFIDRAKVAVPVLMRKYKSEICAIMASINDVTVDEYMNGVENPDYEDDNGLPKYKVQPLTVPKLFADVLDLVTDSEFIAFFS